MYLFANTDDDETTTHSKLSAVLRDVAGVVYHGDEGQLQPHAHLIVVGVVGRRYLHST